MSSHELASVIGTIPSIALLYLTIVAIISLFLRNYQATVSRFHLIARLKILKKYILEPLKENKESRRLCVAYLIVGFISVFLTGAQLYIMLDGYPIEATSVTCFFYVLLLPLSRTVDVTRNYWESRPSSHPEFELVSKKRFTIKRVLFKSAIIAAMIFSIFNMIYMLNWGVYDY